MSQNNGFQFVTIASPKDAATWKREVRAHAARNARARKRRVAAHQNSTAVKAVDSSPTSDGRKIEFDTTTWAYERLPRAMSAANSDPFDTFARVPTRAEWFLLHHFRHNVLSEGYGCLPFPNPKESGAFLYMVGVYWIQMAATDSGMLAALLGITCRNILRGQKDDAKRFEALSYLYNYHCLHSINQDIQSADKLKTTTITKTLAMTLDCIGIGDWTSARQHAAGLKRMMELRGDKNTDLDQAQSKLISWLINGTTQKETGLEIVTRLSMACKYGAAKECISSAAILA